MEPQQQEGDLGTQIIEPTEKNFSARDRLSLLTLPLMTLVVAASSYLLSSAGYDGTPIGLLRFVPSLLYSITSSIYLFKNDCVTAKLLVIGEAGTLVGAILGYHIQDISRMLF